MPIFKKIYHQISLKPRGGSKQTHESLRQLVKSKQLDFGSDLFSTSINSVCKSTLDNYRTHTGSSLIGFQSSNRKRLANVEAGPVDACLATRMRHVTGLRSVTGMSLLERAAGMTPV